MAGRDQIHLDGMVFFGRHGARVEERTLGQQFEVDVTIHADLSASRSSDRLADTIDYGDVHATVQEVIEGPGLNLLERLADEIASRILARFPADAVTVRVKKPRLPIHGGVMSGVSVEILQERE
ncbi:MAG: dihydroneopterin aldolase [Chloroflexi bacterium]|nr:dihydroneopterin aldolase [Chloroflexota bacterium]